MDACQKYTDSQTTVTIKYCVACNKRLQSVLLYKENKNVVCNDCFDFCRKCKFYFRKNSQNQKEGLCIFCL
jgi:hypothetical protein